MTRGNRLRTPLLLGALLGCLVMGFPASAAPEDEAPPSGNGFPQPQGDAAGPSGAPVAPAPDARAADVFELSLDQAVQMGMRANLDLQSGSYNAPIAHQAFIGATAAFDTLLTAGFEASRVETPSTFTFTGNQNDEQDILAGSLGVTRRLQRGGTVSLLYTADRIDSNSLVAAVNPGYSSGLTLEVIQPLLRGAGDTATADIRRAQNGIAAARADFDAQVEGVLERIVSAYWELVFAEDNLAARQSSLEVAQELLADAQARLDAEVGTPLDVAEARAGVERRRSEMLQAENARGTVEDQLLALIMPFGPQRLRGARIVPSDSSQAESGGAPDPADEDRYLTLALSGRPELQAAKAAISDRGIDMLVAFDGIRPQLDVTGRIVSSGLDEMFGDSTGDLLAGNAVTATIGVQFSMFVGQRAARANWRAAGWARRQAVLRLKELENRIVVEVRGALRDLLTTRAQLNAAKAEVAAAQEGLDGERDKLEQGKSTPFRVLQKEDDLTDARTRLGRSAADTRIAESALWKAIGLLAQNLRAEPPSWPACCR